MTTVVLAAAAAGPESGPFLLVGTKPIAAAGEKEALCWGWPVSSRSRRKGLY